MAGVSLFLNNDSTWSFKLNDLDHFLDDLSPLVRGLFSLIGLFNFKGFPSE